jgi:hypothetical protein
VLVAVGSLLVLEANSYVVKKAARQLRNRPKRPSDDNKKVKEEGQYVLVL